MSVDIILTFLRVQKDPETKSCEMLDYARCTGETNFHK